MRGNREIVAVSLLAMAYCTATAHAAQPAGDISAGSADAAQQTPSGAASSEIDAIVVTAQRRAEKLQDVPVTVSAFSGDTLQSFNVKSVQDLATLVPGFQGPGESGSAPPHLRGVGSQNSQAGIENSVATYVDGVYIGSPSAALLQLSNVKDVEVLKGPQGTLFGRNTTGGVIQIQTRDPGTSFELDTEAGYANHDTAKGWFYVGGPLDASVRGNLSVQASTQDKGWGTNLSTGEAVYRADLDLSARSKWNFDLGESTRLQLIGDYEKRNDQGFFAGRPVAGSRNLFGLPSTATGWDIDVDSLSKFRTEAWGLTGQLSHDFGFATLTNILAYRHTKIDDLAHDGDMSPLPFVRFDRFTTNAQWTDEIRLASPTGNDFTWSTGLFYYNAKDDSLLSPQFPQMPPPAPVAQAISAATETESYAAFAQADYRITPSTTLTLGLRYTDDKQDIVGGTTYTLADGTIVPGDLFGTPAVDDSVSKGSLSWRLAASQKLSGNWMVYASYNRGTRSGGFNPSNPNNPPYAEEKLDAYEIGSKLTFLDGRAALNISGFHYDYSNIQVVSFTATSSILYNGAAAKMDGLDADLQLRPFKGLTVNAALEVLHSEFTSFPNADIYTPIPTGGYALTQGSVEGNALPFAPKFTGSLAVNYAIADAWNGTWDLSGTWSHNSGFWGDSAHSSRQSAYDLLGASILYTSRGGRYTVRLWGTNLTNEQVAQALPITPITAGVVLGAPRLFGITLGFHYQ